jgi:hypothetical protein
MAAVEGGLGTPGLIGCVNWSGLATLLAEIGDAFSSALEGLDAVAVKWLR